MKNQLEVDEAKIKQKTVFNEKPLKFPTHFSKNDFVLRTNPLRKRYQFQILT